MVCRTISSSFVFFGCPAGLPDWPDLKRLGHRHHYTDQRDTLTGHPARVISDVQPVEGPGYDYRVLEILTPRKKIKEVILTPGTQIDVFFEMNG